MTYADPVPRLHQRFLSVTEDARTYGSELIDTLDANTLRSEIEKQDEKGARSAHLQDARR
jgi:hypothetical protein